MCPHRKISSFKAYHIYRAKHPLRKATYPRPWIFVGKYGDRYDCFPIVTEILHDDEQYFEVSDNHKDFSVTGLNHTLFILHDHVWPLALDAFVKHLGKLPDDVLEAFKQEIGH